MASSRTGPECRLNKEETHSAQQLDHLMKVADQVACEIADRAEGIADRASLLNVADRAEGIADRVILGAADRAFGIAAEKKLF
jgi:uncharacterized protein (DUF3084 family)